MVTTIVTIADSNPFSLICVILELYLTPRTKPKFFRNSVKQNVFSKFEFIALKVVSATFLLVCFLSLSESTCQTRKNFYGKMKFLN